MFRTLMTCTCFLLINHSINVEIRIKQGSIKGVKEITLFGHRNYFAFYGIPYAEAPVRKLRFKNPKTIKRNKTIDATVEYKGACAQAHIVHKHGLYGVEDCLHLNLYSPQNLKKYNSSKAVIAFFHGYAFTSSFSHMYGPDFFIDNDVIFITITYRLGVFGFLKTSDGKANGNMGLMDMKLALKWIKSNIKKFGGDPNKITVMGCDSAATLLSLLLTEGNKLTFSKMILHSGSMYSPSLFQGNPIKESDELQKSITTSIFETPTMKLINASRNIYKSRDIINLQRPVIPFTPLIMEKKYLNIVNPDDFILKASNQNTSIPLLIGFNSQESVSEIMPFLHNPRLLKHFEHFFKYMVPFFGECSYNYTTDTYKMIAQEVKKHYFGERINEMSIREFMKYMTDLHVYPIYHFIKKFLNVNRAPSFVYKFNYRGEFNAVLRTAAAGVTFPVKGAAKGDELCYLLRCEPLRETYIKVNKDLENKDRMLIAEMAVLWSNFAKFGDPIYSTKFNFTWKPWSRKNKDMLLIEKNTRSITTYQEEVMYRFWDKIYKSYYNKSSCKENSNAVNWRKDEL